MLAVPTRNTSRTCSACGHVSAENRQKQARFACVECGYENNADLVGAINILNRGIKMLGGQDPADASAGFASTARIASRLHHLQGEFLEIPELVHEVVVILGILAKAHPVIPGVTGAHHDSSCGGHRKKQGIGGYHRPGGR